MSQEETYFNDIGNSIENAIKGQLFGKACFKVNKKAFCCFFENEMVFKLDGDSHEQAIKLTGATLFDPSKKKRPMKAWVQVPYTHHKLWKKLAQASLIFVQESNK